jgi:hypothetical protein
MALGCPGSLTKDGVALRYPRIRPVTVMAHTSLEEETGLANSDTLRVSGNMPCFRGRPVCGEEVESSSRTAQSRELPSRLDDAYFTIPIGFISILPFFGKEPDCTAGSVPFSASIIAPSKYGMLATEPELDVAPPLDC